MSKTTTRRETARERDERLVAEAGPWFNMSRDAWPIVEARGAGTEADDFGKRMRLADRRAAAAARILNSLTRKRRKGTTR